MRVPGLMLLLVVLAACGGISVQHGANGEGGRSGSGGEGGASLPAGGSGGVVAPPAAGTSGEGTFSGGNAGGGSVIVPGDRGVGMCPSLARPAAPECSGVRSGALCPTEGKRCECLTCGLADIGRRTCECENASWVCAVCEFPDWFEPPPRDLVADCTTQVAGLACANPGELCAGAPGGEACLCWPDDGGSLIWDCDRPPSSWSLL